MVKSIEWNLKKCMKLTKIISSRRYDKIVEKYHLKGCYTNNYMLQGEVLNLINKGDLSEICTTSNAFFFVQKLKCLRLYYYLNNIEEPIAFDEKNFVTEILYRGEAFYPRAEVDFLKKCGFSINLIRDQYVGMYKDLAPAKYDEDITVKTVTTIAQVKYACELFNNSFDQFSGDFIPESEYKLLWAKGAILIAMKGNEYLGALHQSIENNVAWLSHIAVEGHARGRHIGQALVDSFVAKNRVSEKTRYMLWVQHQNIPAVSMYQKKGFKYINKSTISLVKINK